jgi:RNA polymerase sigma-70 factor (ECF subfamily)
MASIVGHFQGPLQAYLLRLCGNRELAEDLSQETFVRVLANLHRFDDRFRFSTWLFTIARRLWLNHAGRLRPLSDSDQVERQGANASGPAAVASDREHRTTLRRLLDAALATLTGPQRDAVLLYHQQGMGIGEIARQAGVPEGTVKSHLFRARRRMMAIIQGDTQARSVVEEVLR